MAGLSDVLTTVQNGVTALNNLARQLSAASGPWTVWTPTPIPGTGAFTTASAIGAYFVIGKLVHFSVSITVTAAGTAASTITIALPPLGTAKRAATVVANETVIIGFAGYGRIAAGGTDLFSILKYDNTTFIINTAVVVLTGIYELT